MDQPIDLWDECHDLFCILKDFNASGTQDEEVTKSLYRKDITLRWT